MSILKTAKLRDSIGKTARLLVQDSVMVSQRGAQPMVRFDRKGKVVEIVLPSIPDEPSEALQDHIQGYLDHETGHVLDTDNTAFMELAERAKAAKISPKRMHNVANLFEDVRINACMIRRFKGSAHNITNCYLAVYEYITPLVEKSLAIPDPEKRAKMVIGSAIVPWVRGLLGDVDARNFMDKYKLWDFYAPLLKAFPALVARLDAMQSSQDAADLAFDFVKATQPPKPKPKPQPKQPPEEQELKEEEKQEQKKDDKSEGEDQEEGEPESGEGQDTERDSEGDGDGEQHEEPSDEEAEDEDEGGQPGEGEDGEEGEDEEEGDSEAGADEEEDGEAEGEKPDDRDLDDEGADGEEADESQDDGQAGEDSQDEPEEGAGNEADGEPEDEEGEAEGEDTHSSGATADPQDDAEDEEEGDSEEDGEAEADGQSEPEEGEEQDGDAEDGSMSSGSPDPQEAEPDLEEEGEEEAEDEEEEGEPLDEEQSRIVNEAMDDMKDIDDTLSNVIAVMMPQEFSNAPYIEYTRDWDKIEPAPAPENAPVDQYEEDVAKVAGVMQKDLQRIITARNLSVKAGGFRRGRLNATALHRLQTGDDRVFYRKQDNNTKDVAVQLVCDNSGSMDGAKMILAMKSAWAFASILDRLGITNEVIGFTTAEYPEGTMDKGDPRAEMGSQIGVDPWTIRLDPIYMPVYKSFDEKFGLEQKRRIAAAADEVEMGSNIDGASLLMAATRLLQRKEKRKLMIVFSDGQPAAYMDNSVLRTHLQWAVQQIVKDGAEVIGIGIMDQSVKQYYPKSFVVSALEELPARVLGELRQFLTA
jgi:hypothetical protein